MIHINILTCQPNPFMPNWDRMKFPESEYDIQTNSEEDIEWDCVVVRQNVPHVFNFKCKEGNVIYTSGEPPMMYPCPRVFTNQFDLVIAPNKKIRHRNLLLHHGFLSWSLGRGFKSKTNRYTYQDYEALEHERTKLFSIVSSNQQMMPGHNKRVAMIEKLQRDYPNQIDVFGRGYQFVDFKADALLPYRFHICMENSSIEDYWTEKIIDPVLAQTVPIYAGCTNIDKYLGTEGYFSFDVEDYDSLKKIIDKILKDPDGEYAKKKTGLENLRKIIMEKENLIPFVIDLIDKNHTSNYKQYTIKPITDNYTYAFDMWVIRFKRFVFKKYYQIFRKDK